MPPSATAPAHDGELLERVVFEIKRVIVGQDRLVERMLVGLLARGTCCSRACPGVAKTLAVETVARVVGGTFARLQFTPDLVPADILGTRIYRQGREEFDVELGPVVANFVLADEINRAPAKVQSAMLEVMAERHVSIGGRTFPMPDPFLVLATQNPIENEGVYPLPEAQRDRFLFKIIVDYPGVEEEREIVYRMGAEPPVAQQVIDPDELVRLQGVASRVFVHHALVDYVVRLVVATARPPSTGWATSRAGSPTARPRAPRWASWARRGRWRWSAAATTCCPRTCSTWRRTCCGTGWCCPTTRWPTRCRWTTSSAGCWRRSRCRRSPPAGRRLTGPIARPPRTRGAAPRRSIRPDASAPPAERRRIRPVTAPAPPGGPPIRGARRASRGRPAAGAGVTMPGRAAPRSRRRRCATGGSRRAAVAWS